MHVWIGWGFSCLRPWPPAAAAVVAVAPAVAGRLVVAAEEAAAEEAGAVDPDLSRFNAGEPSAIPAVTC